MVDNKTSIPKETKFTMSYSFEPIEGDDSSTGPIGPGRPVDPNIKRIGDDVLDIFTNLMPNSRWQNPATGKPFLIPIPDEIVNERIEHRDGSTEFDKKTKARQFATKIKQYVQRSIPEEQRELIQVGVIPHVTAAGVIFTLGVRRFAPVNRPQAPVHFTVK